MDQRTLDVAVPVTYAALVAASAMWLIVLAGLASWALVERSPLESIEQPVAWAVLASALITVPAAIVGGLGNLSGIALLAPPVGPVLSSLPALVAVGWAWRADWRPHRLRGTIPTLSPLVILVAGLALLLLVLSIGVAIRRMWFAIVATNGTWLDAGMMKRCLPRANCRALNAGPTGTNFGTAL